MNTPEQDLLDAISGSRKILGDALPRLITRKPQVAMNACKNQLTGQSIFMPPAELAQYLSVGLEIIELLRPVGVLEIQHVQRIVDINWRLNRASALEGNLFNSYVAFESQTIKAAHPSINDETLLVSSQTAAYDHDRSNLIDRIGRHAMRLERSLRLVRADHEAMRKERIRQRGDKYDVTTCKAYAWYQKLAGLADRLIEAREELKAKTTSKAAPTKSATPPESATSPTPLFCIIREPLTPETVATFTEAGRNNLLTAEEVELFAEKAA
jgi:hypothetical protein